MNSVAPTGAAASGQVFFRNLLDHATGLTKASAKAGPCAACSARLKSKLAKYIRENVSTDVDVIVTDEFNAYPTVMKQVALAHRHKTIKHKSRVYVDGDIHMNTVESAFSLLKRGIMGTWHRISAKHLSTYLDEMTWRFNNRKNPFLFRDTLLKLIASDNLEYKELISSPGTP